MRTISFDPTKNVQAGYYELSDKCKPLADVDKQTLLRLMFAMTYTEEGRELLKNNRPSVDATAQQVAGFRKTLREQFNETYGVTSEVLIDAMIDAHFAASYWVLAQYAGSDAEMDKQQAIYQQNMAVVTWCLWEDFNNHEFSMNW